MQESDSPRQKLEIFATRVSQDLRSTSKSNQPREIRINPSIILDIIEKFKVPLNPTKHTAAPRKGNEPNYELFTVAGILKSLAHNKHNDSTTTYYLLHKKWLQELDENIQAVKNSENNKTTVRASQASQQQKSNQKLLQLQQEAENSLVTLSTQNCEQIIFKVKHLLEKKQSQENKNLQGHAKNLIKIKEDK